MAEIKKKIENLKPGKEYLLTVRAKNMDVNAEAELAETIRFTVPADSTIPSSIGNLQLFQSLQSVMFVFDFVSDDDIARYEYELYSGPSLSSAVVSSGFNDANVFTVALNNLYNSATPGTGLIPYWGRVRAIDTTGNVGLWTSLVETDGDTPLIDEQYVGSITASKITAGTIGAQTIQLNGANSILRSSGYIPGTEGWIIKGDGSAEFMNVSIGGSSTIDGLPDLTGIDELLINFNNRNDRNPTVPANPIIPSDGTAVDHTLNTDGTADISLEWTYNGTGAAYDIDGFIIYVRSSQTGEVYTFGVPQASPSTENNYPINADKRAMILYGVPANRYYTFGVQAFRVVDTDINSNNILRSAIIQSTASGENPYRPSATVAFAGNVVGTLDGVAVATVINDAATGVAVASDFYSNNDRNDLEPPIPTISTTGTAVDHTLNPNGSANISFEWGYTTSTNPTDANNIDGFIVTLRSSASSTPYILGSSPASETIFYVPADRRALIFSGIPSTLYYTLGVRAYRNVDSDINSSGILLGPIIKATGADENPYRPSATAAFTGDINGTLNNVPISTIIANSNTAATISANYNVNNDRSSTPVADPTLPANAFSYSDVGAATPSLNKDGSANIAFRWNYTGYSSTWNAAGNIDGFIITVRSSATDSLPYTIGTDSSQETTYFVSYDKRAFILYGAASDRYYTFAVRAYRLVDSDINTSGMLTSANLKSTASGENPYQPSTTVPFAGDLVGSLGGVPVPTIVSNVSAANTVVANYNLNNDRNPNPPPAPTLPGLGAAIDHTVNDDGSVDISFEWIYTVNSILAQAATANNNIDGFIVTVQSSDPAATPSSYTMGSNPSTMETNYYVPATNRAFFLQGVPANRWYTFGVRAYRVVDADIDASGMVVSLYAQSAIAGENPYRPSQNVAFAGNLIGTIGATPVSTITTGVNNFNNNNDRNSTAPRVPTSVQFTAPSYNLNASADLTVTWSFDSSGTQGDIDGFIVYLRTTTTPAPPAITVASLGTASDVQVVYVTAEKRSHTFSGVDPSNYYRTAVRAFRVVDTDIATPGVLYSNIVDGTIFGGATPSLGGSTGIRLGNGIIYIGTGNYNNANTGFYVDSTGNMSLKDKFVWNNAGGTLSITGEITATTGTIGGFLIGSTSLTAGATTNAIGISTGSVAFHAGSTTPGSAPFRVTNAGVLTATNADITGTINASGGTFSGSISSTATITGGTLRTAASGARIAISGTTIDIDSVGSNGAAKILFSNSTYFGVIESNSGLSINAINSGTHKSEIQVGANSTTAEIRFQMGTVMFSTTKLLVKTNGAHLYGAYASSGAVATADSGYRFMSDTDTGMFGASDGVLALAVNGVDRLAINANSAYIGISASVLPVAAISNDLGWNNAIGQIVLHASQRKYKENITDISIDSGGLIDALRPRQFTWKKPMTTEGTVIDDGEVAAQWRQWDLNYGFIAEEVAEVDVHLCNWTTEGGQLAPSKWDSNRMIAIVVSELQSVRERLALLEEFVNTHPA